MDIKSNMDKVCIIGAGSSGLAAAKTFAERGIPFDCLERENDIGGLWNPDTKTGVVYDTTYLVSSRKYTGFEDYPMPEEYDLFAVGLIQANGSIWRLADDQSKLVASFIIAASGGHGRADWLPELKAQGPKRGSGTYVQSERHRRRPTTMPIGAG